MKIKNLLLSIPLVLGIATPAAAQNFVGVGISSGEESSDESYMINVEVDDMFSIIGRLSDTTDPEASILGAVNVYEGAYVGAGLAFSLGEERGNLTQADAENMIVEVGYNYEVPELGIINLASIATVDSEASYKFVLSLGNKF